MTSVEDWPVVTLKTTPTVIIHEVIVNETVVETESEKLAVTQVTADCR